MRVDIAARTFWILLRDAATVMYSWIMLTGFFWIEYPILHSVILAFALVAGIDLIRTLISRISDYADSYSPYPMLRNRRW